MDAYLLHCINHVYTTAALIKKNNDRLKAAGDDAGDAPRDQGFTRAKVCAPLCCTNSMVVNASVMGVPCDRLHCICSICSTLTALLPKGRTGDDKAVIRHCTSMWTFCGCHTLL